MRRRSSWRRNRPVVVGLEEKAQEFRERGSELYLKAE